jgi:hypothetical protein
VTPTERADLAESLVPVAAELAFLIRDEGREAIGEWLDCHGVIPGARITEATRAFLVVLAAMVRADVTQEELLEWITWDEHGRPLEPPAPPCGTFRAFRRHKRAGELVDDKCQQAAREYWHERERLRKKPARRAAAGDDQRRGEAA